MASVTLAESARLSQDDLVIGLIENIVEVNQMFDLLPFDPIEGNALAYNRENALGSAGVGGVDTGILAGVVNPITGAVGGKNPATFTPVAAALTSILGDAEVNGLIQATRSDKQDQRAIQVASKAKMVGRIYQHMLINGIGGANQFLGLIGLCPVAQMVNTGVAGANLSFDILDNLIDLVKDKDGQVDYIIMPFRTRRAYYALLRGLGGASIGDTAELPGGKKVPAYRGVPIFVNEWIPLNQVKGGQPNCTTIFAGTFDDGSRTHGIAGLTAKDAMGLQVERIGPAEDADTDITRVKWYCGLALFSGLGIACADGIRN